MKDSEIAVPSVEDSIKFAPRQSDDALSTSSCPNDNNNGSNSDGYSPSKIFQRHRSLAELSSVAVSEKQALEREDSNASVESLQTFSQGSQGFESSGQGEGDMVILTKAEHQTVPMTPTKVAQLEELQNNDPLTPTANLKMLMSVVSPAIRDREEKRKDLTFMYTDSVDNVDNEEVVVIEKQPVYSRKDKSLGLLCQRFLAKFPENPGENPIEICLDEVSKELKVERRRVYDIVNVLESVEVLSRVAKNRYLWHGKSRIAQTLGKLKVLARSQDLTPSKKVVGKENQVYFNKPKNKMKRCFSSGDLARQRPLSTSQPLKERNLTKEDERRRIKAAIELTDHCRKDKSLGVLSQKFLLMFLLSKSGVVTLEDAANVLLDEQDEGNVKYKTKVRRLYDIANILSSLQLIEKVHIRGSSGKKPGFKWIGLDINGLPDNMVPNGPVLTFKTKHSLLPDTTTDNNSCHQVPTGFPILLPSHPGLNNNSSRSNSFDGSSAGKVRWHKSASCSASLARRASSSRSLSGKRSTTGEQHAPDGFLVHEFASSPVNVLGRNVPMCSPTDITFSKEIQRLREKFPNRMSQLLAVLPFSPSRLANGNKTSRRNLFNQSGKMAATNEDEPCAKKSRGNSAPPSSSCTVTTESVSEDGPCNDIASDGAKGSVNTNKESNAETVDNQTKFIHSTNSPFKVMTTSCVDAPADTTIDSDMDCNDEVLHERQKTLQRQKTQFRGRMIGGAGPRMVQSGPRMVQLVDQAVSPIPACKVQAPGRASIAVQASLIKDISPLKPLMLVHRRIPSPWKLPATSSSSSSSSAPPAPPSTPELPNELPLHGAPFQSQAATLYLRPMSPYPMSQSCGASPVPPFSGARLFFPPSPSPPTTNAATLTNNVMMSPGNNLNVLFPQGNNGNNLVFSHGNNPNLVLPQGNNANNVLIPQGNKPNGQLVFAHGNLLYNVGQIMTRAVMPPGTMTPSPTNHQSSSCPSSINPSPTALSSAESIAPADGSFTACSGDQQPTVNISPVLVETCKPFTPSTSDATEATQRVVVPAVVQQHPPSTVDCFRPCTPAVATSATQQVDVPAAVQPITVNTPVDACSPFTPTTSATIQATQQVDVPMAVQPPPFAVNTPQMLMETCKPFTPETSDATQATQLVGFPMLVHPPVVNASQMLVQTCKPFTPITSGVTQTTQRVSVPLLQVPHQQTTQLFSHQSTDTTTTDSPPTPAYSSQQQHTTPHGAATKAIERLGATPCPNMDEALKDITVSRKLRLASSNHLQS